MTNQEVYDKVKSHLLSQNRKSLNSLGECMYRGRDGTKCAIGCLIPDEKYHMGMEGLSVGSALVWLVSGLGHGQVRLATRLRIGTRPGAPCQRSPVRPRQAFCRGVGNEAVRGRCKIRVEPMTNQEMYDRVKSHLLTQNCRSGSADACRYRGQDGTKCAIGCLIPDERYTPWLEGRAVGNPHIREAAGIEVEQTHFAHRLQRIHDLYPVEDWATALRLVATEYGLNP